MELLVKSLRNDLKSANERAEQWKVDHDHAMKVRFLEDLTLICAHLVGGLDLWLKHLWKELYSRRLKSTQSAGREVFHFFDLIQNCLDQISEYSKEAENLGYSIDFDQEHEKTEIRFNRIVEHFRARWPYYDEEACRKIATDMEPGIPAEDYLREIQGRAN